MREFGLSARVYLRQKNEKLMNASHLIEAKGSTGWRGSGLLD
jgi:hypothetical protein